MRYCVDGYDQNHFEDGAVSVYYVVSSRAKVCDWELGVSKCKDLIETLVHYIIFDP